MHTAKLSIRKSLEIQRWGSTLDSAEVMDYLLGSFWHNGQIVESNYPSYNESDYLSTIVNTFHADALERRYFNQYVSEWFVYFAKDDCVITPLGEDINSSNITTPEQESAFILTTNPYTLESPVIGLDSLNPVPIHYLPKTYHDGTYFNLLCWKRDYQACDGLQMRCYVGEKWALNQMGEFDSELTTQGREICQILAEKLQKPVYYYLHKYYISENQEHAKCPSCGGDWRLPTPLHERYDFKCDRCFLLSNLGISETE